MAMSLLVEDNKHTLAGRLKAARTNIGLSQQAVADAVPMAQPSYQQLESGQSKRSVFINEIAKVLHTNTDWLMYGKEAVLPAIKNPIKLKASDYINLVPILNWKTAGIWAGIESVTDHDVIGQTSRPENLSNNGFALRIPGQSMAPEFNPGEIIYVEPQTDFYVVEDSDLVIVKRVDDVEVTFKQLTRGESLDDMYLRILNPNWPDPKMIPIGKYNLIGKVVGKYVEY